MTYNKFILFCITFLSVIIANGQSYYQVTTTSPSNIQTLGGVSVTVQPLGHTGNIPTQCHTGPYCGLDTPGIQSNITFPYPGGYKYKFSSPVDKILFHVGQLNHGDTLTVKINGVHYSLTNANLSADTDTAGCSTSHLIFVFTAIATQSGDITSSQTTPPTNQNPQHDEFCTVFIQPGYGIDSAEIDEEAGWGAGFIWDFYFYKCPGSVVASVAKDTICAGDSLKLFANAQGLDSPAYTWSGPGFSSNSQNPVIPNAAISYSGVYTLTVHDTGACVFTSTDSVFVSPYPNVTIQHSTPVCDGSTFMLFAVSNNTGVNYLWSGPNSLHVSNANVSIPNVTFADAGYYSLQANLNNCTISLWTHITVQPTPAVPSAGSNEPVCVGDTLKLRATDSTAGVSYYWSGVNNFTSTLQDPFIANAQLIGTSGTYIVHAILNGCESGNNYAYVTVKSVLIPSVNVSSIPTLARPGVVDTFIANVINGSTNISYQWYFNGSAIPGADSPVYIGLLPDYLPICVEVHINALCARPDSIMSCYDFLTGIENIRSEDDIDIFPNPASSWINVISKTKLGIEIVSIDGRRLLFANNASGLDISNLSPGIYLVKVYRTDAALLKVKKLVKE